jgi:hypothetical protein
MINFQNVQNLTGWEGSTVNVISLGFSQLFLKHDTYTVTICRTSCFHLWMFVKQRGIKPKTF